MKTALHTRAKATMTLKSPSARETEKTKVVAEAVLQVKRKQRTRKFSLHINLCTNNTPIMTSSSNRVQVVGAVKIIKQPRFLLKKASLVQKRIGLMVSLTLLNEHSQIFIFR